MRSYIEHEDALINQRITWSLAANSFLFIALALTGSAVGELSQNPDENTARPRSAGSLVQQFQISEILIHVLHSISLVGAFVGTITPFTVLVAVKTLAA